MLDDYQVTLVDGTVLMLRGYEFSRQGDWWLLESPDGATLCAIAAYRVKAWELAVWEPAAGRCAVVIP